MHRRERDLHVRDGHVDEATGPEAEAQKAAFATSTSPFVILGAQDSGNKDFVATITRLDHIYEPSSNPFSFPRYRHSLEWQALIGLLSRADVSINDGRTGKDVIIGACRHAHERSTTWVWYCRSRSNVRRLNRCIDDRWKDEKRC